MGTNLGDILQSEHKISTPLPEQFLRTTGGFEEQIAFKSLSGTTHPDSPEILVKAVVARTGLPGRVFVQPASIVRARKFTASSERCYYVY